MLPDAHFASAPNARSSSISGGSSEGDPASARRGRAAGYACSPHAGQPRGLAGRGEEHEGSCGSMGRVAEGALHRGRRLRAAWADRKLADRAGAGPREIRTDQGVTCGAERRRGRTTARPHVAGRTDSRRRGTGLFSIPASGCSSANGVRATPWVYQRAGSEPRDGGSGQEQLARTARTIAFDRSRDGTIADEVCGPSASRLAAMIMPPLDRDGGRPVL